MTGTEEDWTLKLLSTFRTMIWFVSVCQSTPSPNNASLETGLPKLKKILLPLDHGSLDAKWKKLLAPFSAQTKTGPLTLPVLNSVLFSDLLSSVNCPSKASTPVLVLHTSGVCTSSSVVLAVVWLNSAPWSCTTTPCTPRLLLTTQISSTGISVAYFPRTLLSLTHTESGELASNLCSICPIKTSTGTDTESLDMYLGMVPWTSLLSPTCTITELVLPTVLSSSFATPLLTLNEELSPRTRLFCLFKYFKLYNTIVSISKVDLL